MANSTQTIPTNLYIAAKVTNNEGTISKVEFYNGSTKINDKTWAPYEAYYINAAAGTYIITAKVYTSTGATATSAPVTVTVLRQDGTTAETNTPPTVTLTSPSTTSSFTAPASVTIAANASDAGGSISKVEFFNGTTKLGEDLSSPYSFTWSNVNAGTYTLTAKATDNSGHTAVSAPVNITVAPVALASCSSSGYCLRWYRQYNLGILGQCSALA